MPLLLSADWGLFFGRFHPLVVHLPIGLLLLAAVLEWAPKARFGPAARLGWITGGITAVVAVICGWLLAGEGGYGSDLGWHRWLGVITMVLGLGGVWFTGRFPDKARWYGLATLVLVTLTGHLGGKLTHGEQYLWQYAPSFIQKLAGANTSEDNKADLSLADPDSVGVYVTFIRPVLDRKCVQCHGTDKQNGSLRLDSLQYLQKGGESGPLYTAGQAMESEWLHRVTLPRSNSKAMPPSGEPLSYAEIRLLAWWVDQGADPDTCVGQLAVPDDIKALLMRDYRFDTRKRPYAERLQVAAANPGDLKKLEEAGWKVHAVAQNSGAIRLGMMPGMELSDAAFQSLGPVTENVVWLDLEGAQLPENAMETIGKLPNLVQLRLQQSNITDEGIARLSHLRHLESLNLYGTQVTDAVLTPIEGFPALKRLYLWQTQTTKEGVEMLRKQRPDLEVDTGVEQEAGLVDAAPAKE